MDPNPTTDRQGMGGEISRPIRAADPYVAPTRFVVPNSESFARNPTYQQGSGFANGQLLDSTARRVTTMADANGTVALDCVTNTMGLLFKALMGSGTSVQQASTTAYLQTFTLADTLGVSFSGQVGIPDLATGTLHPYSFTGGKVTGTEFSCDQGGILGLSVDCDFQTITEGQSLVTPSYVSGAVPFHFGQEAVKIGAYGSEAAIQGVTKVDVKIARNYDTSRFYANNLGVKSEPVTNAKVGITGTLSADLVTKSDLWDRYAQDTSFSLILSWVGTTAIASTYYPTVSIALPSCYFTSGSPTVAGLDVINGDLEFVCLYDGTHLPVITYMTTDTTI
jgi:hypothetical protein